MVTLRQPNKQTNKYTQKSTQKKLRDKKKKIFLLVHRIQKVNIFTQDDSRAP